MESTERGKYSFINFVPWVFRFNCVYAEVEENGSKKSRKTEEKSKGKEIEINATRAGESERKEGRKKEGEEVGEEDEEDEEEDG